MHKLDKNKNCSKIAVFISCKLMFNLQEVLGADMRILSTHGHIFVTCFAFLLDTINRFYLTKYGNVL